MLIDCQKLLRTLAYELMLAILLVALLKNSGVQLGNNVDALQAFWGTVMSETYNFYKFIPVLSILFLFWLKHPNVHYLFIRLNSAGRLNNYYFLQLLTFVKNVVIAWGLVFIYLAQMLKINPDNITFSLILLTAYMLNLIAFLIILLLIAVCLNKVWSIIIITGLLYADQWLHLHLGYSVLFYHGLITGTISNDAYLSSLITNCIWSIAVILIGVLLNYLLLRTFRSFKL